MKPPIVPAGDIVLTLLGVYYMWFVMSFLCWAVISNTLHQIDRFQLVAIALSIPIGWLLYLSPTPEACATWLGDCTKQLTSVAPLYVWLSICLALLFVTWAALDLDLPDSIDGHTVDAPAIRELFYSSSREDFSYNHDTSTPSAATSRFKITTIMRLKNTRLDESYQAFIYRMPLISYNHVSLSENDQMRCSQLFMTSEKDALLFHATPWWNVRSICENGFSIDLSRGGVYGTGLYFTDCSHKADWYTGWSKKRYMFVVRVALGQIVHAQAEGAGGESRLGSMDENYTEFVALHNSQCLPVYLIEYKRKW